MTKRTVFIFGGLFLAALLLSQTRFSLHEAAAQAISPTPLTGRINTATPLPAFGAGNTIVSPTPTATVTVSNLAYVEPLSDANVRANADPQADVLGVIQAGTQYQISGRYFQWFRIRYDKSPNGIGWVHESVVTTSGDLSSVADLTENAEPTLDPAFVDATQTWAAITLTPGIVLTATANSRLITGPVTASSENLSVPDGVDAQGGSNAVLPTFTPPPEFAPRLVTEPSAAPETGATEVAVVIPTPQPLLPVENLPLTGEIAPIIPIALLGGLGLAGLFVSAMRR